MGFQNRNGQLILEGDAIIIATREGNIPGVYHSPQTRFHAVVRGDTGEIITVHEHQIIHVPPTATGATAPVLKKLSPGGGTAGATV